MISESQNIEYKESWNDKYLEWICGFANAQGGSIYIGVNDDKQVVGVSDSKRLMEDIPNKIVTHLGIVADINLLQDNGKDYIEIVVAPSDLPISCHGKYHYRSGSTKQELKGIALQQFVLKKMNLTWEMSPCPYATIDDIDTTAISFFVRRAIERGRIPESCKDESPEQILRRLRLVLPDGSLSMAAVLLFGREVDRWCSTSIFRIARFGCNDADIINNDDVICPLILMPSRIMETLRSRYLVTFNHFEGLDRIENLEIPREGLREILCNSIIHKDYQRTFNQMKVWDDRIELWNPGELPQGVTIETFMEGHHSEPRNKEIARVFYLAGYIEAWGTGYTRIRDEFEKENLQVPTFEECQSGFKATIQRENFVKLQGLNVDNDPKDDPKDDPKELTERQKDIIAILQKNNRATREEMTQKLSVSDATVKRELADMQKMGILIREGGRKDGHWVIVKEVK